MNHKITHAMVGIVAVALLVAVGVFSLVTLLAARDAEAADVAARPVIPFIAHPVNEQMADCTRCHVASDGGLPASHTTYGANTCLTCHVEAPPAAVAEPEQPAVVEEEPAPAPSDDEAEPEASQPSAGQGPAPVPHPAAEPYTNCVACHAIGGNLGMPENHASFTNGQCTNCHAGPSSGEAGGGAGVGPLVPHDVGGQFVNCDTCHAFGMGRLSMPENHAGFTKEICTNCHKPAN